MVTMKDKEEHRMGIFFLFIMKGSDKFRGHSH